MSTGAEVRRSVPCMSSTETIDKGEEGSGCIAVDIAAATAVGKGSGAML